MDTKLSALAMLDSFIQGLLWAVLCYVIIERFQLESLWYFVCVAILFVEIGMLAVHQKITFPSLIQYLGYDPNEKLEEAKKFVFADHIINITIMFVVVYYCLYG